MSREKTPFTSQHRGSPHNSLSRTRRSTAQRVMIPAMSHEPRGPTDGCISAWEGDRPNVGEPERMSGDCNLTIDKQDTSSSYPHADEQA